MANVVNDKTPTDSIKVSTPKFSPRKKPIDDIEDLVSLPLKTKDEYRLPKPTDFTDMYFVLNQLL